MILSSTPLPQFSIFLEDCQISLLLSSSHFNTLDEEFMKWPPLKYFENFYHSFQTFFRLFSIVQEFIQFFVHQILIAEISSLGIFTKKKQIDYFEYQRWISKISPVIKYLGRNLKYNIFMEYSNKLNKIQEWWKKMGQIWKKYVASYGL